MNSIASFKLSALAWREGLKGIVVAVRGRFPALFRFMEPERFCEPAAFESFLTTVRMDGRMFCETWLTFGLFFPIDPYRAPV